MRRHVISKKGFTLIELLVSMLVLSIGMMALLDGIANYIRINMDNAMRNEAMRVAEATMETLRNSSFDDVVTGNAAVSPTETRMFRNTSITFNVNWSTQMISSSSYAIQVHVIWNHRGIGHQHDAATIISTDT